MSLEYLRSIVYKNKTIVSNFSYLSVVQIFNLIVPLIVYPYLINKLGSDTFGSVIFAQAIISYFVIFVNFGFNITGVSSISQNKEDTTKTSMIFSSIFFVKIALFIGCILMLIIGIYVFNIEQSEKTLLILTLWMCIYEIVLPVWYFQGIERMKYITFLTFISKMLYLILVFVFIHNSSDYIKVPILNGVSTIVSGGIAFYIIIFKHHIRIVIPKAIWVRQEIKQAFPIFISNISIQLYIASNKVIVGTFLGMKEVALYDLAEKVLAVLRIPQVIFTQTIFPKISREKNLKFIKKIFNISIIVSVLIFILGFLVADYIIDILGGTSFDQGKTVLRILLITIPITAMSNVFGVQVLVPFGFNKEFSKGIVVSCLFYFTLLLGVWSFFGFTLFNVSYVNVATEIFVTCVLFYFCKKNRLW